MARDTGWDGFTDWARTFFALPDFDAEERDYKFEMVRPFQEVLPLEAGPKWIAGLRRGFGPPQNIVVHYAFSPVLDWATNSTNEAWSAVHVLWSADGNDGADVIRRLDEFDERFPQHVKSGPGVRLNVAAYLLGAVDPIKWPNYRVEALKDAYALSRFPEPGPDTSMGERYAHALNFFDTFISEAHTRGLEFRDRLDAQSLMWAITRWTPRPTAFLDEEWNDLLEYRTIPSALRKPATRKVSTSPKRPVPPPQRLCPLCGINGEVTTFGRSADGGWLSTCTGGPGHDDPYDF